MKNDHKKYTTGEYQVWQGYDGVWYWQVYKPQRSVMTGGNAGTESEAENQAKDAIRKRICSSEVFNSLKYKFRDNK